MSEFPIIRKRVLAYVLARGGAKDIGPSDLSFSVARQHNQWVTDAIAHKYWCVIYDLHHEGLIEVQWDY
jgi:hypothetical protein